MLPARRGHRVVLVVRGTWVVGLVNVSTGAGVNYPRIDPPFLPRRVIRVAELPRNEVGKLTDQAVGALRARLDDA